MSRLLITAFVLILFSCTHITTENKSNDNLQENYTIDTVLSDYSVKLTLPDQYLTKGIDNEVILKIKNVPDEQVVIFTRTSEATVRINNDTTGYLILPEMTADSVGIFVNINDDGKMTLLGKIYIGTK